MMVETVRSVLNQPWFCLQEIYFQQKLFKLLHYHFYYSKSVFTNKIEQGRWE